jgi:hypothetical protein
MEGFRKFFEQTKEQEANIKATLARMPKKHTDLIKDYKIIWQCDNVLDGDGEHVGIVNPNNKTITVAAPYRYSREFTFIHEIAHKVWNIFVAPYPALIEKWKAIIKNTKNKMHQNAEELFCHGYAATYAKNPPTIHHHEEWTKFIKSI